MKKQQKKETKSKTASRSKNERSHFSPAIMKIAENNLKKLEAQSDEGFLVRADMDRKLSSL